MNGTAAGGALCRGRTVDFVSLSDLPIVFPAGTASRPVSLTICSTDLPENLETALVNLTPLAIAAGADTPGTLSITDP